MEKLEVLYDGACILCYKEVIHYKKLDKEDLLILVNIADKNFNAQKYGLTHAAVDRHIHVIDSSLNIYKGIDSFIQIWKRIPRYQFLIPIFENKFLKPFFKFCYNVFAQHIRPKLPKRNCDNDSCHF